MMTENPCNCSTCSKKKDHSCKFGLADITEGFTKVTGCFDHPQAREHLMKDVIEELEHQSVGHPTSAYIEGLFDGFDIAISLIKKGVVK